MAINSADMIARVASKAKASGKFDRVNTHEPKNKPGRGLTCAIWVDRMEPARGRSGLNTTSARVVLNCRIYTNMLQNPQDAIDPRVLEATDYMFEALSGDFDLGSDTRWIDLLGASSSHPLYAQSGYINIDNMVFRVMTITVPIIVEDAWAQAQ